MSSSQTRLRAIGASWRTQSPAVRVIRLWLGITWIYGGWDKATDPGFLTETSSSYIGRQLTGYADISPLGFLFQPLIERATLVGIFVMVAEFAIGLATLFWVAPTLAAFAGFTMSLGLWIAATWYVQPYFLASDTAYAVLWLSYFLALVGKRRKVDILFDRRGAIRVAALAVGALVATLSGRILLASSPATATNSASGGTSRVNQIIKLSNLAVGQTHEFATSDGQPAILFRTRTGVFAYSQVCTHQGCTVGYSAPDRVLICPCHGATYDPFNGAKVLAGPTQRPLPAVKVAVSGEWVVFA